MNLLDLPERRLSPPALPLNGATHERRLRDRATEEWDTNHQRAREFVDDMRGEPIYVEFMDAALDEYRHRNEDTRMAFEKAGDALRDAYVAWRMDDQGLHDDVTAEMSAELDSAEDWQ